jgi:hypothetical protein
MPSPPSLIRSNQKTHTKVQISQCTDKDHHFHNSNQLGNKHMTLDHWSMWTTTDVRSYTNRLSVTAGVFVTVKAYTSTFPPLHQFMSVGSRTVTYILLECSAPHCDHCSHKTLGVHTHITYCADGHSHQHHHDAQLCVPWIAYAIKQDFEQAWDWDHTQLCNLHHKNSDQEHMEINTTTIQQRRLLEEPPLKTEQ